MADGPDVRGIDDLLRRLQALPGAIRDATANELYSVGEEIIGDAQENYVPVDEGILKSSGFVEEPKVSPAELSVTIGFGGPASDYAAVQHERTDFEHTVGVAKYLETPALQRVGGLGQDIAAAVEQRIAQELK